MVRLHLSRRAVIAGGLATVVILGVVVFGVFRWLHPEVPLKVTSGRGYSVSYPSAWSADQPPTTGDVIAVARDPKPTGSFESGLIVTRTTKDPYPLDHDVPAILVANQLNYANVRVLRKSSVSVHGAKEAVLVVSEAQIGGQTERIVDILARTSSDVAFHLQAVAPPTLLTDATIDAIVAGLSVS